MDLTKLSDDELRALANQTPADDGVDYDKLVNSVIKVESAGNPNAISNKGARGLMQIMPATGQHPPVGITPLQNDTPEENIRFGRDLLKYLIKENKGDLSRALSAYNQGQGNLNKRGIVNQKYVNDVLGHYNKADNTMDLSKLSDADLQALSQNDLSKLSDEGLALLGGQPAQTQEPQEPSYPTKRFEASPEDALSGIEQAQGVVARGAIEGVAKMPQDVYNTASSLGKLVEPQAIKEKNPLPAEINTMQYGTKLADALGLPKETDLSKIPLDMVRSFASTLTGAGGLKAAGIGAGKFLGATTPLKTAIASAGGKGASDVAQEITADSENESLKTYAPLVAGVLGNMAATGGVDILRNISPTVRGARAVKEAAKNVKLPDEILQSGLEEYPHELTQGVAPTAAMKYSNPAIQQAETMARLRNKESFFNRDTENARIIANALRDKASQGDARQMLAELNATTSPMREEALGLANAAGGYELPIAREITNLTTSPGTRYSPSVATLTKPISDILEKEFSAEDLYTVRKRLADALKDKTPMSMDETTNAAKNARREATLLKNAIDEGIDVSSSGKWNKYLKTHREGMKLPNELEAWQRVSSKFDTAPEISPGVPNITPNALRTAIEKKTKSASGRDLLSEQSRQEANQMVATMNAIERARNPRAAISGSQTAPLLMEATKQILPDKIGSVVSILRHGKGFFTGNNVLDDALLNPEKLPKLIETAIKTKDDTMLNAISAAVARNAQQQGE